MPEINFFWDPLSDNILQERDETGAVTAEYTAEPGSYGNVISQNRGGVESQFHYDAQGSTLAVTDDNQNVTDTFAYTAFGEVTERTGTTEVPFQYIGQRGYYTDGLTGQYLARRRPYEPVRMRWASADPHAPTSSDYVFALNRPLLLLDPSGQAPLHVLPTGIQCWSCVGHLKPWSYDIEPTPTAPVKYVVIQHIRHRVVRSWCRPSLIPCVGRKCVFDFTDSCEMDIYEFIEYIEYEKLGNLIVEKEVVTDTWSEPAHILRDDLCDLDAFIETEADVRAFKYSNARDPRSGRAADPWVMPVKPAKENYIECGRMGKSKEPWVIGVNPYLTSPPSFWGDFDFNVSVALTQLVNCCGQRVSHIRTYVNGALEDSSDACGKIGKGPDVPPKRSD